MTTFWNRAGRLLALALIPVALAGCGINTIPTQRVAAQASWGEVQNQYQRRADLIPNLVSTVQGAAVNERTTLTQVQEARSRATAINVDASTPLDPAKFQQYAQAQSGLSSALGRLLVVSERYPDLKTNQNFLALQSQLEGTENRIAIARRDYNGSVQTYNTTLATFPGVLWAGTFYHGDKAMQLFQAAAESQAAPKVNFNFGAPGGPPPPGAAPGSAPPPAPVPASQTQ